MFLLSFPLAVMEWGGQGRSSVSILSWRDSRQRVWWTSSRLSSLLASRELALSLMLYVPLLLFSLLLSITPLFTSSDSFPSPLAILSLFPAALCVYFHIIVFFVSSQAHYAFCHEVVATYVDSFETYANFKEVV